MLVLPDRGLTPLFLLDTYQTAPHYCELHGIRDPLKTKHQTYVRDARDKSNMEQEKD